MTSIVDHWLLGARWLPSPNSNARPDASDISLIVIHGISLPPGSFGGPYIDQLFANQLNANEHDYFQHIAPLKVSSHLLIQRDGALTQYVAFDQRAWHAGQSQFNGRDNCNDFSIGIELEGTDEVAYTEAQYRSLLNVLPHLQQVYPLTRQQPVVGHCDIAPGRKTDPGDAFDWQRLRHIGTMRTQTGSADFIAKHKNNV
jgi:AmpD protein